MKKILSIAAIAAVTLILSTGCSSNGLSNPEHGSAYGGSTHTGDNQANENAIYVGHASSKKVMNAIKVAGEKTGWRVTEYKSDAVLVEKEGMSSTIKFHNGHIAGESENADMSDLRELRSAILEALENGSSHH